MNKTFKKTLGALLSVSMIAASVVLPTAASAAMPGTITIAGTTATISSTQNGIAVVAKYDGTALRSVTTENVTANVTKQLTVAEGDKVMLWNKLDGNNGITPLADAKTVEAAEEPEELNILRTWKFDFGATDQAAEDGWIAVDPSVNLTANTDGGYGFIGTNEMDYSLDGGHIDGFVQQEGQTITLTAGGGSGLNDGIGSTGQDTYENAGDKYYPVRFALKVDDNTYYRVKATVTTYDTSKPATASLYTERKHPLYTEKTIPAGETVTTEFTVRPTPIFYKGPGVAKDDGMVNVCVLGENTALASLEIYKIDTAPVLWVLGDSTVTDGGGSLPFWPLQNYTGVGTGLTKYLPKNIAMVNEGEGGLNATDAGHFNMVDTRIKAGDYMYVEYGHNHKNNSGASGASNHFGQYWKYDYLQALQKYYNSCKTPKGNGAGETGTATLIIVGPIDRHNDSQYNSETNTWSSTLGGFSKIGRQYVDCLKYGGEDKAVSFIAKWKEIRDYAETHVLENDLDASQPAGAAKAATLTKLAEMEAEADALVPTSGATVVDNVAFVDLNQPSLDFYTELTKETKAKSSTDYYFQTPKGGSVDGTHPNDTGAENLAYYFFTTADQTKYPAIAPLLANFKAGAKHEVPTAVSADVIAAGAAGKSDYWPLYAPPVAFEYPIVIKDITFTENGHFDTLKAVMQASYSNYAVGIVDIYNEQGEKVRQILTTNHMDNTNPLGTYTINFDTTSADTLLDEGETYKAYMWSKDMTDGHTMTEEEGGEQLSSIYTPTDIDTYLLPGEKTDVETFSYYGKTSLTEVTKYKYGGSSTGTFTLGTDAGGVTYSTLGSNGGNSFFLWRALENLKNDSETEVGTLQSGKYMFDADFKYVSGGGFNFQLSEGMTGSSPFLQGKQVTMFRIGKDGVVTINGEVAGTISGSAWTNVKYILDMNTGKASISVAGADPVTVDIDAYKSFGELKDAAPTLKYFVLNGEKSAACSMSVSNMTMAKLKEDTKNTVTISVNDNTKGSVTIDDEAVASKTVLAGENVTIKATATAGSVFSNWTTKDGTEFSKDETVTLRMCDNIELTANFVQALDNTAIASYDIVSAKSKAKVGETVNLSLENVKSSDNTPIKTATNSDVTWSCEEPGITISEAGVVSLNATSIGTGTTKNVTIKGVLNDVERTCTILVYNYDYYENFDGGDISKMNWFTNLGAGKIEVKDGALAITSQNNNNNIYSGTHFAAPADVVDKLVTIKFDYKTSSVGSGNNTSHIFLSDTTSDTPNYNVPGTSFHTDSTGINLTANTQYTFTITINNKTKTATVSAQPAEGAALTYNIDNTNVAISTFFFRPGRNITDTIDNVSVVIADAPTE